MNRPGTIGPASSAFSTGGAFAAPPWSRRSFLGSLAAMTLVTTTGCSPGGLDDQDLGGARPQSPSPSGAGSLPGKYVAQHPYLVTADSEVSEDYYLVQNLPIDPKKDTVVACSRSDGQVEAVVLHGNLIVHYYPDPTKPGGLGQSGAAGRQRRHRHGGGRLWTGRPRSNASV